MTLEQLRIFVAVAERQHVTQAAAQLNLTQSAVSSAVSALETRHDVKLFDRVGRNIVLNQVGEAFLKEARAVLARAAAAEAAPGCSVAHTSAPGRRARRTSPPPWRSCRACSTDCRTCTWSYWPDGSPASRRP